MQFNKHTHTHTHTCTHTEMGTGVENGGRTQDENGDGSKDGNESNSGDGNGDENRNGDGIENGIYEGRGKAKKRKKPHKRCRRDQALSFRTRNHLCRQGVAFAETRQLRSQGPVSAHAYLTEGVTGSEGRGRANRVGSGIIVGGVNGDGNGGGGGGWNEDVNVDGDGDGAGTRTGWRRRKERKVGTGTVAGRGGEMGVKTRGLTQDGNE